MFGGSRALTRRRRPHRASDSPSAAGAQGPVFAQLSVYLLLYVCSPFALCRACSSTSVCVCVCVCFPVARDKLVPAPATPTSGHHHTCNSGLQNPFSQLLLMRYGNEIVQYTTAYSRGNSSLFGTYDGFAEALLCCVVLCCVFGLLQREINTHLVSTCVNWRRMMISIGGT